MAVIRLISNALDINLTPMTTINWISGTACDLFLSLFVLHHANEFGVRRAWAAGVRQRISAQSRETLEHIFSFSTVPLAWISSLPAPHDAITAIDAIASYPPSERLSILALPPDLPHETRKLLDNISARGSWTSEDRAKIMAHYGRGLNVSNQGFDYLLKAWLSLPNYGENYLIALQEYYNSFFIEEEQRIRSVIESGLKKAKELAENHPPARVVEYLSRGVRLENPDTIHTLTLFPSWWVAPLAFLVHPEHGNAMMAFGVRSELHSGSVGAEAPETLVTALKTLGDPIRLRILKYLSKEPLSPSELARRLRLRPPTVIHHLRLLRFAGLVQVTVSENMEKRYAARFEALHSTIHSLKEFLDSNG